MIPTEPKNQLIILAGFFKKIEGGECRRGDIGEKKPENYSWGGSVL
jgi:hypothetical protein